MNADLPRKNSTSLIAFFTCVACVTAILYWRRPDAFYNPQFWAEDGSVFFTDAFFKGVRAFGIPYGGYFHILGRSVAWLGTWLPARYAPHWYNLASWMFLISIIVYIFSPRFSWGWRTKFLLGLVLVVVPGDNEVFFNVANWESLSSFFWLLLAISNEPQSKPQALFDGLLLLLAGLNSPFVVCLWPLFLWRWYLRRTRQSMWLAGLSLIVAVIQIWNMPARMVAGGVSFEITAAFWDAVIYRFGFMFLGESIYQLRLTDPLRVYGAVAMGVFYGGLLWHGLKQKNWSLVTLTAGGLFANSLSFYVMRHNLAFWAYLTGRHFYIPAVAATWALLISNLKASFARRWALGMMYVAFVFLTPGNKNQVLPDLNWAGNVAQCMGTRPECKIPINPVWEYPRGWFARMSSHVFDKPALPHPLLVRFGEQIEFLGYDSSQTLTTLNLKLVWHAVSQTPADYKFFVHVYRPDNLSHILTQTDQVPLNGQYPTSKWVQGEIIMDEVTLPTASLPPGGYQIGIGWYDSTNLVRLPAYDVVLKQAWNNNVVLLPLKIDGP